jgi:osmoprotectant transport system substrate-binding protein
MMSVDWLRLTAMAWLLVTFIVAPPATAQPLRVGGKAFTEQLLMVELTSQLLRAKGYSVVTRSGRASSGVRLEQESGLVDIYWEYTGTSLRTFNNIPDKLDPEEAYQRVKDLDARKGLVWLNPSKVDNTYALAMRESDAEAQGISSISDLAAEVRRGRRFVLACTTEFFIRPDGLVPLQREYAFEFGRENVVRMDVNRIYDALVADEIDIGLVFATDGRIAAQGLRVLRDDRGHFPSYLLTPVVRRIALDRAPDVATHLNALSDKLDNATMARLNALVDIQRKPLAEVASSFLRTTGLI